MVYVSPVGPSLSHRFRCGLVSPVFGFCWNIILAEQLPSRLTAPMLGLRNRPQQQQQEGSKKHRQYGTIEFLVRNNNSPISRQNCQKQTDKIIQRNLSVIGSPRKLGLLIPADERGNIADKFLPVFLFFGFIFPLASNKRNFAEIMRDFSEPADCILYFSKWSVLVPLLVLDIKTIDSHLFIVFSLFPCISPPTWTTYPLSLCHREDEILIDQEAPPAFPVGYYFLPILD